MAEKNSNKDQTNRSWGDKAREYIFGKKGKDIKSAEDAVKKLRKRKGRL